MLKIKKKGSYRSLFTMAEHFFSVTRLMAIIGIALWIAFNPKQDVINSTGAWITVAAFAFELLALVIVSRQYSVPIDILHRFTIGFDILFITSLIYFTGGINSNFYLLYYLIIAFSAYYYGLQGGILAAFISTTLYLLVNFGTISEDVIFNIPIRLFFAWFYAFIVGVFSKHIKHSSDKLLNLLDTLNERTTELERTQIQLETIYETSRSLGEIHNLDDVFIEVNNIAEGILGYPMCAILLLDREQKNLELAAKVVYGAKEIFKNPERVPLVGAVGKVIESGKTTRIADIGTLRDYQPILKDARSEMTVPMIARGKIIGMLVAESNKPAAFSERDEKLFSILAASAGMAIDNARMHKRISDLTVIDDLTGIYNYRYFVQKMEDEKKRAARYNLPLSLIMMDLDWFKKTNDTYGHEVGNIVLKEIVQVVKSCIRDTDMFCRYGGEEFMIILPLTKSQEAVVLGERIRQQVERHDFSMATLVPGLKITVSLGTTSFPDNGLPTLDLVQTVDMALYRAKGSGKNIVCSV